MTEVMLSVHDIEELRGRGLLREGETAVKFAEMILAIDPITKDRRVIDVRGVVLESSRRVLRD